MKNKIAILILFLAGLLEGFSQGFVNLNFETPTFVNDPSRVDGAIYASNAIPGWTACVAGAPLTDIFSNFVSLSGGSVSIMGTNSGYSPIEGRYFMLIQGFNYPGFLNTAAIGQTGTISLTALSMTFWGNVGANDVSFNGQTLPLTVIGSTPNYNIYAANISVFAGQFGQLLFTTVPAGNDTIDNIQFLSTPVPEPSELALVALGISLLGFRHWQNFSP